MRKSEQSLTATDMVLLVVYGQGPLAEVTAGSRPIWLPSLVVSVSPYFSRRDLVGKRQNLLMPSLIALLDKAEIMDMLLDLQGKSKPFFC